MEAVAAVSLPVLSLCDTEILTVPSRSVEHCDQRVPVLTAAVVRSSSGALCIFRFMDDVMFACNGPYRYRCSE